MSLNQLISPVSNGLNLNVHNVQSMSYLPLLVSSPYTLTSSDLQKQRLLFGETVTAITITMPTFQQVADLLPEFGDTLLITIKYRTSGAVLITGGILFIVSGSSYNLLPSNGSAFVSHTIDISRNLGGLYIV